MLSTTSWLMVILLLIVIKYVFILPREDKLLFSMYAARDAVAFAAARGEIDQETDEYNFVIRQINFEIYYTKNNYNFAIFMNNILRCPEEAKERFESMYKMIEQYEVLSKSIDYTKNKFIKNIAFRLFMFNILFIKPMYFLLSSLLSICIGLERVTKVGLKKMDAINRRRNIVRAMNNDYESFRNSFAAKII